MTKINKYANGIERFLHGEKGQRFFNFAYSIGAAIVIWGALFKILHLPGGSLLLCIGMGTEIAMFILTAFDRPPREYNWEEVFPVLDSKDPADRPDFVAGTGVVATGGDVTTQSSGEPVSDAPVTSGPVTIVQGGVVAGSGIVSAAMNASGSAFSAESYDTATDGLKVSVVPELPQLPDAAEFTEATQLYVSQMKGIAEKISELNDTYATQMQDLNRNVGGLNTIYEIQLKNISAQLATIDRVNNGLKDIRDMYEKSARESASYCEETEKMARYMRQLNAVYEKMITAMTINMQNPMMGAAPQAPSPFKTEE